MKLGSLCSGAGGLDMAVEQVSGAETVWHCEQDKAASKVLAHRWPGIPNHGDLIAADWPQVEPVDILCFGWPCQPFSTAGQQKGAADERAIWPQIAGAIRILRPRICAMENVAAVIGSGELWRAANDMAEIGYDLRWTCLRASDVGAPHRRERLFIVAHADDGLLCPRPGEMAGGTPRRERTNQRSDRRLAGGGAGSVDLLPTPNAQDGNAGSPDRPSRMEHQVDLSTAVVRDLLPTPLSRDAGGSKTPEQVAAAAGLFGPPMNLNDYVVNEMPRWDKYGPAIHRWETLTRPAPPPTEPNTRGNPRLNAAFSEWMMGWPEGWVTHVPGISRNDQLRIIGNGVCPQQATAALNQLLGTEVPA